MVKLPVLRIVSAIDWIRESSSVETRIVDVLRSGETYSGSTIAKMARSRKQTVLRELTRMAEAGLIRAEIRKSVHFYCAKAPILPGPGGIQ